MPGTLPRTTGNAMRAEGNGGRGVTDTNKLRVILLNEESLHYTGVSIAA